MMKRVLSIFLVAILCLSYLPISVSAEEETCPNHPIHEGCSYQEAIAEQVCTHVHDANCTTESIVCLHEFCNESCTYADENAEPHCHHECSAENGCITITHTCEHTADGICCYVPAQEAVACDHCCELCTPINGGIAAINDTDDGVEISAEFFPGEIFRDYVRSFDENEDGVLSPSEIANVTEIDVQFMEITDLTGIEYFSALTYLDCEWNRLAKLDISKNTALTELNCSNNELTDLDVSQNTALISLSCNWNNLTELDLSKNTNLASLECGENQLTRLDASSCPALTYLHCNSNQLRELDISSNVNLSNLGCGDNQLTELIVRNNPALTALFCGDNQLTSLDVSNNPALTHLHFPNNFLTTIDVCTNPALIELYCFRNQLVSLDLSKNTALEYLDCAINQLTELDVRNAMALQVLDCNNNQLTSLDVSNHVKLSYLICNFNVLTELNVSGCTALETFDCSCNALASLDVSSNINLVSFCCGENRLKELNVDSNTALESLECGYNYLSALDVSHNTALKSLGFSENKISEIDISKHNSLENLYCVYNNLTELDISHNPALIFVNCAGNKLKELDVGSNTALEELICSDNYLTSMDFSQNTALTRVDCDRNTAIVALAADGTFDLSTLPSFDVSKTSNWTGGSVDGSVLTVSADAETVTYTYDCGQNQSVVFTLVVNHTHTGSDATCMEKAKCSICGMEYGELAAHTLCKIDAVAATCTGAGNREYYTCTVCGKYYSDADGETEITKDSWVLSVDSEAHTSTSYTYVINEMDNTHTKHYTCCGMEITEEHEFVDRICICGAHETVDADVSITLEAGKITTAAQTGLATTLGKKDIWIEDDTIVSVSIQARKNVSGRWWLWGGRRITYDHMITFEGKAEGSTIVKVGEINYNITVTKPTTFMPEYFTASIAKSYVAAGKAVILTVKTSKDVEYVTINGEKISSYKTSVSGWGRHKTTYHIFTYTITENMAGQYKYMVYAYNSDGLISETARTLRLTVTRPHNRPSGFWKWWG